MKRFDQVRLIADRTKFGQVAWVTHPEEETTATGPLWEVQVQWGGEGGNVEGHYLSELRRETFLEFLFRRPGYMGKMPLPHVVWFHVVMLGVGIAAWWVALPFVVFYYFGQYLNFKGIIR